MARANQEHRISRFRQPHQACPGIVVATLGQGCAGAQRICLWSCGSYSISATAQELGGLDALSIAIRRRRGWGAARRGSLCTRCSSRCHSHSERRKCAGEANPECWFGNLSCRRSYHRYKRSRADDERSPAFRSRCSIDRSLDCRTLCQLLECRTSDKFNQVETKK